MKRLLVDLRRLFSPKTPEEKIWGLCAADGALAMGLPLLATNFGGIYLGHKAGKREGYEEGYYVGGDEGYEAGYNKGLDRIKDSPAVKWLDSVTNK